MWRLLLPIASYWGALTAARAVLALRLHQLSTQGTSRSRCFWLLTAVNAWGAASSTLTSLPAIAEGERKKLTERLIVDKMILLGITFLLWGPVVRAVLYLGHLNR